MGVSRVQNGIQVESEDGLVRTVTIFRSSFVTGERVTQTLGSLERDTVYKIRIRIGVSYSACLFTFDYGDYSAPVSFRTDNTSKIQILTKKWWLTTT